MPSGFWLGLASGKFKEDILSKGDPTLSEGHLVLTVFLDWKSLFPSRWLLLPDSFLLGPVAHLLPSSLRMWGDDHSIIALSFIAPLSLLYNSFLELF